MALTNNQKYDLLTLDGKDVGISHLTFFKLSNMTIATTEYVAEMLMKRIDLLDSIIDTSQIGIWKITEIFKNSSGETVVIRVSYSDKQPLWIANDTLSGLLS